MRCASVTTVYAFTGTGTTRGTYQSLTVGTEGASCAVGQYVVLTQAEFDNYTASPFRLTTAEGGQISGAILSLWALAWGFRQLMRLINSPSASADSHD